MVAGKSILTLTCDDQPGIVSAVSEGLFRHGGNILESAQFFGEEHDKGPETGRFFMRVVFSHPEALDPDTLRATINERLPVKDASIQIIDAEYRPKILIMVSRVDHCYEDLLYRVKIGTLKADVVGIVSNHDRWAEDAARRGIPFHHLPVTPETKKEQEAALDKIIEESGADLVILARYMQVLTDAFSNRHFGRIINIHHSFLPAFKGAHPYRQAWQRGVKLIGATAHYVTPDLDEGPIIVQDAEPVTHVMGEADYVATGRDIESRVLARAVRAHLEQRVFLHGSRTVVFA
ncbi:formyltetrahydrofolate deformylase [Paracoccaceae bacterium GXU_MW_L88]